MRENDNNSLIEFKENFSRLIFEKEEF